MWLEDVLNLFIGTLVDDDARRTVEFCKDPHDINEVVDHAGEYAWTEPDDSDKKTSSLDEEGRAVAVTKPPKSEPN